ncbi:MAG TPA: hypothetical protein VHA12_03420 [Candidatus Nanoarchaeia archaeon]|nr:hypothetical protein [Candidatus Nanoarchaeia archaeon]
MKIKTYLGVSIPEKYQNDQERALAFTLGRLTIENRYETVLSSLDSSESYKIREFAGLLGRYGYESTCLDYNRSKLQESRNINLGLAYKCGLGEIPEGKLVLSRKRKDDQWTTSKGKIHESFTFSRDTVTILGHINRNPSFIPWEMWEELELAGFTMGDEWYHDN